jgi:glucosamine-phosphate N-acetyltransferase
MEPVIRELDPADVSHGLADTLASLAEVGLTPDEMRVVVQERSRMGIHTYVACDPATGEVVGTASLLVERKFIHRGGRVGHLEDVSVRKGHRGKGTGAALVRHVLSEARRLHCYKVILSCFEQIAPLYTSLGFRKHDIGMRIDLGMSTELR